jgi:ATP-dependent DNA helicase RecQ
VRKALSGVARAKQRGGLVAVGEMLHGDLSDRVERFGFDRLSTFAVLRERSNGFILSLLRALLAAGWIDLTPTDHPVPFLTPAGWRVMTATGPVRLRVPEEARPKKRAEPLKKSRDDQNAPPLEGDDAELFEALRAHRAERAKERRLPAYVVAQDATLIEIARRRPRTESDLLGIRGMGPLRVESYGEGFLEIVRRHIH